MLKEIISENRDVTSIKRYKHVGYGMDVKSVYAEYETTFSIKRGIIKNHEFTGFYVTSDYKLYDNYIK